MRRPPLNAALVLLPLALSIGQPALADDDAPSLFVTTQDGAIHCDGHNVNVASSNAKLTFTGHCKGVYFIGDDSTATIESADLVQTTGSGIDVNAKGTVAEVYSIGAKGRLHFDRIGELRLNSDATQVEAGSIATIDAVGSDNVVHWTSGKPIINDMGRGNVLKPAPKNDEG